VIAVQERTYTHSDELAEIKRFLSYVGLFPRGACWLWQGQKETHGYGIGSHLGETKRAHRWAHELFIGPVGELNVCHSCDTPACVNPNHLFLGAHGDNMRDLALKNRARRFVADGEVEVHDAITHEPVNSCRLAFHTGSYT
jgi:hypothetical protein